ncbi:MAG: hypothetical protein KGL59_13890 [Acidobacteriota bacterium]|nr:hypothetical protein [Acidobacteriota bacterium]
MKLGKNVMVAAIAAASLGLGASAMAQVRVRNVPIQPFMRNFTAMPVVQATQQQPQAASKQETFTGTVAKSSDGSYVLEIGGASYQLDDQTDAVKFMGKEVKVTGVLDANTHTIHVTKIQPAN